MNKRRSEGATKDKLMIIYNERFVPGDAEEHLQTVF